MRSRSAVVSTTTQVWVPLGQFLLLFLTPIPPPGIVSVHQTALLTPQPHLRSSFCLEWSFSPLPGAGPFSSIKSQHVSPLPNQTESGVPGYSPFITLSHVGAIASCFFCLCLSVPHREPCRTGTLSRLVLPLSSFHHGACVQQTSHARCYLTRPLGPEQKSCQTFQGNSKLSRSRSCSSGPTQFPAPGLPSEFKWVPGAKSS